MDEHRRRLASWRTRDNPVAYAMLLPAFVPYALFALLPIAWLGYYSFFRWNGVTNARFVGLDNYARVFRDGEWWAAVVNTLQFAAAGC